MKCEGEQGLQSMSYGLGARFLRLAFCCVVMGLGSTILASAMLAQGSGQDRATNLSLRYRHDLVFSFSFAYGKDWRVEHSNPANPAYHWVKATHSSAAAAPTLWVTAIGHEASLLLCPDPERLVRETLARDMLRRNPQHRLEISAGEKAPIGNLDAQIAAFALTPEGSSKASRRGYLLYAVANTSVLAAEFSWRENESKGPPKGLDERARAVLNSFRTSLNPQRQKLLRPVTGPTIQGFSHLATWPVNRIRTDDNSVATQLEAPDGTELVLRSLARKDSKTLGRSEAKQLAKVLLVDQMKLFPASRLEDAARVRMPGGGEGIGVFSHNGKRGQQVVVFERGGSVHLAFLSLPAGWQGRSWGLALQTIASLHGGAKIPEFSAFALKGDKLEMRCRVRRPAFDLYDENGVFRGGHSADIQFETDGRYRATEVADGENRIELGQYRVADGHVTLTSTSQQTRVFLLEPAQLAMKAESGDRWRLVPDLH
ncbi:MAG: hypothetical protein V3W41_12130 [Planctomycetota bacterium]